MLLARETTSPPLRSPTTHKRRRRPTPSRRVAFSRGRDNLWSMRNGQGHLTGGLLLVSVAVAGLMSMHGFDPAVVSLDHTEHTSHSQPGAGLEDRVIGLCVFVVAVATLGLTLIRRLQGSKVAAISAHTPRQATRTGHLATYGPPILHRLCVLRL
jgi:hypothetical protein